MATLSDVAARAGVSRSVASRVLSKANDARVGTETRQRIEDAARELDYRPNYAARALRAQRTGIVSCIVPDLTNAVFAELTRGVEEAAREHGLMVLLSRSEGMPELDESLARLLGEGRVDGAVVQMADDMSADALRVVMREALPVIFINSVHPEHTGSVILDDAQGVRVATQHLIDLGHERIAFAGGLSGSGSAARRAAGFEATMADAGLPVPEGYVTRLGYQPRNGEEAVQRLAALQPRPTGLVVANINAAMGALLAARRGDWAVPGELSVVAIHDAWPTDNTWPPLTTVRMPLFELGVAAIEALVRFIDTGVAGDQVVERPAPVLVLRDSTARPA